MVIAIKRTRLDNDYQGIVEVKKFTTRNAAAVYVRAEKRSWSERCRRLGLKVGCWQTKDYRRIYTGCWSSGCRNDELFFFGELENSEHGRDFMNIVIMPDIIDLKEWVDGSCGNNIPKKERGAFWRKYGRKLEHVPLEDSGLPFDRSYWNWHYIYGKNVCDIDKKLGIVRKSF